MFKINPKIFAHQAALENGNYVLHDHILHKLDDQKVKLFKRYCPHRMYPLHKVGDVVTDITCKFHNFKWDMNGAPINNDKNLGCGKATIGQSGLIFTDFTEPNHSWVSDLLSEKSLKYSHSFSGMSKGNWLWMMDIQADLLHIQKNGIHPELSQLIDLDEVITDQGDGWALQTYSGGWWLCIYPYTFVEYSKGCLAINYTVPNDKNDQFNFDWFSQFYFDPLVEEDKRKSFQKYFQDVFLEDLVAIEKQKGKYFPLMNTTDRLETHCVHFGEWYLKNSTQQ
jgi:phenylpropionate dioxygenase-like ring-hydroxylating dioxygenase large terminal subunit